MLKSWYKVKKKIENIDKGKLKLVDLRLDGDVDQKFPEVMNMAIKWDKPTEYDNKKKAWEKYISAYHNNFETIDIDKDLECSGSRIYITQAFKHNEKLSDTIKFSGETDFNFKKKRGFGNHYGVYKKLLETNQENFQKNIEMLDECYSKYKSSDNISIMPRSGNLQAVKKGIGNDRLDVFIWSINEYYSNSVNLLLNQSTGQNINCLKSFLAVFDNVYEYCKEIYHINDKLVRKLIASGSQAIDSAERVVEYMALAMEFWRQKSDYISRCLKDYRKK